MSGKTLLQFVILAALLPMIFSSSARGQVASSEAAESAVSSGTGSGSVGRFADLDASRLVENATDPKNISASLEIMLILTVLSLAPAILVMSTCFIRVVVVLALLRQAIGTQQLPPSQVIIGLALFLTFLVMAPTWSKINNEAVQPYIKGDIAWQQAWGYGKSHVRRFMFNQIEATDNVDGLYMLAQFDNPDEAKLQKIQEGKLRREDISLAALIPAFVTSELKQAFIMGFYIYMPFLIIDMVVASLLMSMGMMMLPPIMISLPFKLLLFVLVDGWHLVVYSLLNSFM